MRPGLPGRPLDDRHALARAFVAKAVLNLADNLGLIERLAADATLRLVMTGWERRSEVPSEEHLFSRLRRVCGERLAGPRARGSYCKNPQESPCWPHLA